MGRTASHAMIPTSGMRRNTVHVTLDPTRSVRERSVAMIAIIVGTAIARLANSIHTCVALVVSSTGRPFCLNRCERGIAGCHSCLSPPAGPATCHLTMVSSRHPRRSLAASARWKPALIAYPARMRRGLRTAEP